MLTEKEIRFDDVVSIKIPTVKEVATDKRYGIRSHIFNVSTRELFSPSKNVDELERQYPTVWEMMFDEENDGDIMLGHLLGIEHPASALVMECFEYWTGLDKTGFRKLLNGKIIHEQSGWIVDKSKFNDFREAISQITCYEPNSEVIAPENMTPTRHARWLPFYKALMQRASRKKGNGMAERIIVLQANFSTYTPASEILQMTYFQFLKLFQVLNEKEAYLRNWEIGISPKFESDIKKVKHWSEKVHV